MKIVHLLGWYFPEAVGGTEVYVAHLARLQRKAGHVVFVAAPAAGATDVREYQHQGTAVFRYPVPADATRAEQWGHAPVRGTERLHEWLRDLMPDILHVHTLTTGIGLAELEQARVLGANIVFTAHLGSLGFICKRGTLMHWGERLCDGVAAPVKCAACMLHDRGIPRGIASGVSALASMGGAAFGTLDSRLGTALSMPETIRRNIRDQAALLERCDRFVVLNSGALETVMANGAPPAKVVVNQLGMGITSDREEPPRAGNPDAPLRVGFLGRLVRLKGMFDLLHALTTLPADLSIQVEVRGPVNDDESRSVSRHIEEIAKRDARVSLKPPVAPENVADVLRSYDVFCCPSIWFENGPTVALEAMAVGTPVVGSRVGVLPDVIESGINGELFEPGDWRALAKILLRIASDNRATVRRWRAALPAVRTMTAVNDDYMELYQELRSDDRRAAGIETEGAHGGA